MAKIDPLETDERIPEALVGGSRSRLSVVWLLPLVAAVVGAWLVYHTLSQKGPSIVIRFETAAGVEAGKTRVKYRDVDIGRVVSVKFSEDLSHVLLTAELTAGIDSNLTETTRFWVVRPRVGAAGVSGLDTLISGPFLAMDPGEGGRRTRVFQGLEEPPPIASDTPGRRFQLRAGGLGSLAVGSPVYYRQIPVGEVVRHQLSVDHKEVEVEVFIRAPHDRFVTRGTRFWNAAGFDLNVSADGVNVGVESLVALLAGGVAFETPDSLTGSEPAPEGATFPLYGNHADSVERVIGPRDPYVLFFTDTVRGLSLGAPVEFRGLPIGSVIDIGMSGDPADERWRIPVLVELDVDRLRGESDGAAQTDGERARSRRELVEHLVREGLRARLQTGNLLTGQAFVELDLFPEEVPREVAYSGRYPELPTVPRALTGLTTALTGLLGKLNQLPIAAIGDDLAGTVANASRLLGDPAMMAAVNDLAAAARRADALFSALQQDAIPAIENARIASEEAVRLARDAGKAVDQASVTLATFEAVAAGRNPLGRDLQEAVAELRSAARAVRLMAEYLERRPDALLRGRSGP